MASDAPNVLYIEHKEKACPPLIELLNRFCVLTVVHQDETVDRARASPFDLYLFDDSLLEESGPALCRTIRCFDRDTPILFLPPVPSESKREVAIELKRLVSRLILESSERRIRHAGSQSISLPPRGFKELMWSLRARGLRYLSSNQTAMAIYGQSGGTKFDGEASLSS
jgi:hypothetical protein